MRAPSWLRTKRAAHQTPGTVTMELTLDTSRLTQALREVGRSSVKATASLSLLGQAFKQAAEVERQLARVHAMTRWSPRDRTAGDDMREALDRMELAYGETRPVWGARETAHPMNQALANRQARKRNAEEVRFAGVLATWRVRGGLSFVEYPTVAERDRLVQRLLSDTVTDTHRRQRIAIAVAFMEGWATTEAMDPGPTVTPVHRLWGSKAVQVVAA